MEFILQNVTVVSPRLSRCSGRRVQSWVGRGRGLQGGLEEAVVGMSASLAACLRWTSAPSSTGTWWLRLGLEVVVEEYLCVRKPAEA